MEHDINVKYDSLCYITFTNIKYLMHDTKIIVLKNFNYNDKEHQFVLAIVAACYGIFDAKKVVVDANIFQRNKIAKRYPNLGSIKGYSGEKIFVNVPELLNFMRPAATELCGEGFTFGDIYDAYYGEET